MQPDVLNAILHILPNNRLEDLAIDWSQGTFMYQRIFPTISHRRSYPAGHERLCNSIDVSRFTSLSQLSVFLDINRSIDWRRDEYPVISSFLRGPSSSTSTRHLKLSIYSNPRYTTRRMATQVIQDFGHDISSDYISEC